MPPLALRKGPGAFRKWLFVGLGAATFGLYGLAFVVDRFGQHERAVPSDVLVVLGARVLPGGEPSSALRARIEKAVELYHQGLAPRLLFSGIAPSTSSTNLFTAPASSSGTSTSTGILRRCHSEMGQPSPCLKSRSPLPLAGNLLISMRTRPPALERGGEPAPDTG